MPRVRPTTFQQMPAPVSASAVPARDAPRRSGAQTANFGRRHRRAGAAAMDMGKRSKQANHLPRRRCAEQGAQAEIRLACDKDVGYTSRRGISALPKGQTRWPTVRRGKFGKTAEIVSAPGQRLPAPGLPGGRIANGAAAFRVPAPMKHRPTFPHLHPERARRHHCHPHAADRTELHQP